MPFVEAMTKVIFDLHYSFAHLNPHHFPSILFIKRDGIENEEGI